VEPNGTDDGGHTATAKEMHDMRTFTIPTVTLTAMLVMAARTSTLGADRVSVYGLKAIGTSQDLARALQEHLEALLIRSSRFEVLSRTDIDLILRENRLQ
jgi:hypothetical protein